jgi:hypothetical protein
MAEQWAEDTGIELVFYDGLDSAIVGIGQRFNDHFVVYDYDRVIKVLERQGMSYDDAQEHYEFNVIGTWVGDPQRDDGGAKGPPVFVTRRV